MTVNKKHDEFHTLDMNTGWRPRPAIPTASNRRFCPACSMRNKRGTRMRLLRFAPGVFTTKPFVHEYWEEVFLVRAT